VVYVAPVMHFIRHMDGESDDDPRSSGRLADTHSVSKPTVLCIEADAPTVRFVDLLLEQRSEIRLLSADRGQPGLELARQHRPAVILLDVHLPDMEATDLLAAIRQDPFIWRTPVIVLSAEHERHFAAQMLAAGAQAFLTKPLDLAEFFTALDAVVPKGDVPSAPSP
jgi:CheY-like chemotaxis protein